MSKGQQARGRPALPPDEGKRHAVGFRTTKKVKDFIQQMADSSGRSIAQEIEIRLLHSFDLESALGGPRAAAFFRALAGAVESAGFDERWLDDYRAFKAVRTLLLKMLDSMAPPQLNPLADFAAEIIGHLQTKDLDPTLRKAALDFARLLKEDLTVPAETRAELMAEIDRGEAA